MAKEDAAAAVVVARAIADRTASSSPDNICRFQAVNWYDESPVTLRRSQGPRSEQRAKVARPSAA